MGRLMKYSVLLRCVEVHSTLSQGLIRLVNEVYLLEAIVFWHEQRSLLFTLAFFLLQVDADTGTRGHCCPGGAIRRL